MKKLKLFLPILFSYGCISTGEDENIFSNDLSEQPLKSLELKEERKIVSYSHADAKGQVEMFLCTSPKFTRTALIQHSEAEVFEAGKVCKVWSTQAFADKGFNVIAINRPGYGASTGPKDFAGGRSQSAIEEAIKSAAITKKAPVELVWGYSVGSIAAAFAGKQLGNVKYLIIGNGIFDTETLAAKPIKDRVLQDELDLMIKTEGEDGHEDRSIEWDVEGLPKTVLIYHSELNEIVPYKRAESFRTTLATAEYEVHLFPVKEAKTTLDWPTHQQVLRTLLLKVK